MFVKVTSLNLLTYLKSKGVEIDLVESDEPERKGLFFSLVDMEILRVYLEEYRKNDELHNFISLYRDLRVEIANKRLSQK